MRKLVTVLLTLALLAVGGAAILLSPRDDDLSAPIEVPGAPGHLVAGRELAVTVTGVRLARLVEYPEDRDPPSSTTSGVWVVVDATVAGGLQETSAQWSQLRLGGFTYDLADDAGLSSLNGRSFAVGLPYRGSFVFEVSAAALAHARSAELVLRDSPNLIPDTVPVVRLDLTGIPVQSSVAVHDPGVVAR